MEPNLQTSWVMQSCKVVFWFQPSLEMAWHRCRVMAKTNSMLGLNICADTKTHTNLEHFKSSLFSQNKRQSEKSKQSCIFVLRDPLNVHFIGARYVPNALLNAKLFHLDAEPHSFFGKVVWWHKNFQLVGIFSFISVVSSFENLIPCSLNFIFITQIKSKKQRQVNKFSP